jgi:biopolymer transport protein ExbB/TolQ
VEEAGANASAQPRGAKRSSLTLVVYLLVLTVTVWLVVRHGLNVELTRFLATVVTNTGAEWVMYLLIALSVLSVGVMFERWLFYRRRAVDIEWARARLSRLLDEGETVEALRFLEQLPGMEGSVTATCLRHQARGAAAMQEQMLGVLAQERLNYEKNLSILGTLGNNAPFIGLFGTVLGIIKAFVDLARDIAGGAAAVMAGISEALVATAIGLLVAIPCVVAFNALKNRVKTVVSNTEYLVRTVLAFTKEKESAATAGEGEDGV